MVARAALLTAILFTPALASEPFAIDSYEFAWNVTSEGDARLRIVKNEETTRVYISDEFSGLFLSPEDAAKVGDALSEVLTYFAKFKKALSYQRVAGEDSPRKHLGETHLPQGGAS